MVTFLIEEESVGIDVVSGDGKVVSKRLYDLTKPARHQVHLHSSLEQHLYQLPTATMSRINFNKINKIQLQK